MVVVSSDVAIFPSFFLSPLFFSYKKGKDEINLSRIKVNCQSLFIFLFASSYRDFVVTRMMSSADLGGRMISIESPLLHSIQNFNLLSHSYICWLHQKPTLFQVWNPFPFYLPFSWYFFSLFFRQKMINVEWIIKIHIEIFGFSALRELIDYDVTRRQ